jgi:hypothetical protein
MPRHGKFRGGGLDQSSEQRRGRERHKTMRHKTQDEEEEEEAARSKGPSVAEAMEGKLKVEGREKDTRRREDAARSKGL